MRMWMVDPAILCKNHLLGEHRELHLFCGALRHKHRIDGYLLNGLLDPRYIKVRHEQLVEEFVERGYFDFTPIEVPDFSYLGLHDESCYVDSQLALKELLSRCPRCRERYERLWKGDRMKKHCQAIIGSTYDHCQLRPTFLIDGIPYCTRHARDRIPTITPLGRNKQERAWKLFKSILKEDE